MADGEDFDGEAETEQKQQKRSVGRPTGTGHVQRAVRAATEAARAAGLPPPDPKVIAARTRRRRGQRGQEDDAAVEETVDQKHGHWVSSAPSAISQSRRSDPYDDLDYYRRRGSDYYGYDDERRRRESRRSRSSWSLRDYLPSPTIPFFGTKPITPTAPASDYYRAQGAVIARQMPEEPERMTAEDKEERDRLLQQQADLDRSMALAQEQAAGLSPIAADFVSRFAQYDLEDAATNGAIEEWLDRKAEDAKEVRGLTAVERRVLAHYRKRAGELVEEQNEVQQAYAKLPEDETKDNADQKAERKALRGKGKKVDTALEVLRNNAAAHSPRLHDFIQSFAELDPEDRDVADAMDDWVAREEAAAKAAGPVFTLRDRADIAKFRQRARAIARKRRELDAKIAALDNGTTAAYEKRMQAYKRQSDAVQAKQDALNVQSTQMHFTDASIFHPFEFVRTVLRFSSHAYTLYAAIAFVMLAVKGAVVLYGLYWAVHAIVYLKNTIANKLDPRLTVKNFLYENFGFDLDPEDEAQLEVYRQEERRRRSQGTNDCRVALGVAGLLAPFAIWAILPSMSGGWTEQGGNSMWEKVKYMGSFQWVGNGLRRFRTFLALSVCAAFVFLGLSLFQQSLECPETHLWYGKGLCIAYTLYVCIAGIFGDWVPPHVRARVSIFALFGAAYCVAVYYWQFLSEGSRLDLGKTGLTKGMDVVDILVFVGAWLFLFAIFLMLLEPDPTIGFHEDQAIEAAKWNEHERGRTQLDRDRFRTGLRELMEGLSKGTEADSTRFIQRDLLEEGGVFHSTMQALIAFTSGTGHLPANGAQFELTLYNLLLRTQAKAMGTETQAMARAQRGLEQTTAAQRQPKGLKALTKKLEVLGEALAKAKGQEERMKGMAKKHKNDTPSPDAELAARQGVSLALLGRTRELVKLGAETQQAVNLAEAEYKTARQEYSKVLEAAVLGLQQSSPEVLAGLDVGALARNPAMVKGFYKEGEPGWKMLVDAEEKLKAALKTREKGRELLLHVTAQLRTHYTVIASAGVLDLSNLEASELPSGLYKAGMFVGQFMFVAAAASLLLSFAMKMMPMLRTAPGLAIGKLHSWIEGHTVPDSEAMSPWRLMDEFLLSAGSEPYTPLNQHQFLDPHGFWEKYVESWAGKVTVPLDEALEMMVWGLVEMVTTSLEAAGILSRKPTLSHLGMGTEMVVREAEEPGTWTAPVGVFFAKLVVLLIVTMIGYLSYGKMFKDKETPRGILKQIVDAEEILRQKFTDIGRMRPRR